MSSSVFFKFKSQKEPSRVTFDGTGISVFELKREIIQINKLGDGTDFDLHIYNQETNEEYDDDTTIIPRSTYVTARRMPASRPGRGGAARYVSGKMPTLPNASRTEKNFNKAPAHSHSNATSQPTEPPKPVVTGDSEEAKIAAMFQASSEEWKKTQEQMSQATPVFNQRQGFRKNPPNVPSHPPPQGYVCFRCSEKGHWIQNCPTNSDPSYDGRPRVKRTTGIPKSFLKAVDKPLPPTGGDGNVEGQTALPQMPASVMVNADGEFVIAEADKRSWETYQQKVNTSNAKAAQGSKELQERGIECSNCFKLYKDAVKMPCCEKTFCEECAQQQLLDSDFVCPSCGTTDVLLEKLVPDNELRDKVSAYKKEKGDNKQQSQPTNSKPSVPNGSTSSADHSAPSSTTTSNAGSTTTSAPSQPNPRKRPGDDIPNAPRGPAAMRNQHNQNTNNRFQHNNMPTGMPMGPHPQMPVGPYPPYFPNQMPPYGMGPQGPGFFPGGMPQGPGFMPPYGGPGMMPFPGGPMPMGPGPYGPGGFGPFPGGPGFSGPMGPGGPMNGPQGPMGGPGMGFNGPGFNTNQAFGEEDSAYMRQPVNPARAGRVKRIRQADFKALGES